MLPNISPSQQVDEKAHTKRARQPAGSVEHPRVERIKVTNERHTCRHVDVHFPPLVEEERPTDGGAEISIDTFVAGGHQCFASARFPSSEGRLGARMESPSTRAKRPGTNTSCGDIECERCPSTCLLKGPPEVREDEPELPIPVCAGCKGKRDLDRASW